MVRSVNNTPRRVTSSRARGFRLAAILGTDPRTIIRANLEIQAIEELAAAAGEWPDTRRVRLRR